MKSNLRDQETTENVNQWKEMVALSISKTVFMTDTGPELTFVTL